MKRARPREREEVNESGGEGANSSTRGTPSLPSEDVRKLLLLRTYSALSFLLIKLVINVEVQSCQDTSIHCT